MPAPTSDSHSEQSAQELGPATSPSDPLIMASGQSFDSESTLQLAKMYSSQGSLTSTMSISKATQTELEVFATEFPKFRDLPFDIRLMLWALLSPPPALIIRVNSRKPGRRYHPIRAFPTILHVCQESRNMFLESDNPTEAALERKANAHPRYKLRFQEGRGRNSERGCYISTQIDTIWDATKNEQPWKPIAFYALAKQPIACELRHMANHLGEIDRHTLLLLHKVFPKLESFTVMVTQCFLTYGPTFSRMFAQWDRIGKKVREPESYPPEINGQLDFSFPAREIQELVRKREVVTKVQDEFYAQYPEKKLILIKWRLMTQFLETEGIRLPPPAEEDLLKEVIKYMRSINR